MANILVIEDDPAILRGLADNLGAESHDVLTAADGEHGYALARSGKPDLIILDLMLPRMSGYELCRKLRAEGVTTPIVMLTARGVKRIRWWGSTLAPTTASRSPSRCASARADQNGASPRRVRALPAESSSGT
jgi:CheY-like chemotaxis protein